MMILLYNVLYFNDKNVDKNVSLWMMVHQHTPLVPKGTYIPFQIIFEMKKWKMIKLNN